MEVSSHSLLLLQQLNVQREFGFLCDCTVAIGNVYFKAHRAVLAAFSNYFKMIFIHQSRSGGGPRGSEWVWEGGGVWFLWFQCGEHLAGPQMVM